MERIALGYRIGEVRAAIAGLRDSLDATLSRLDDFDSLVSQTAGEARSVADTLGARPGGGFFPLGFFAIVGVGLAALAIFSPQTLTRWYDTLRNFARQNAGSVASTAQDQLGGMTHQQ